MWFKIVMNVTWKNSCILFLLVFHSLVLGNDNWGVPIMEIKDVKAGMTGIGKTVFYGDKIEEFGVEVIDIVKNFYPKRDVILVRLTGQKAEYTGVVSGMSGSPVYIDGKLVGALAYRFGQFMKEPIGGVMPIGNMFEVASKENNRKLDEPVRTSLLPKYMDLTLANSDSDFWADLVSSFSYDIRQTTGVFSHIQSPLVFSGFNDRIMEQYSDIFASMGFVSVPGGGHSQVQELDSTEIKPGSAVAQVFIDGDYSIETTGTVTAVNNDMLLAFGHYVFNLGPINLPLARAHILATLPSMMGSNKMSISSNIIGTFRQDRMAGVYGDLSRKPAMIPIKLVQTSAADGQHEYNLSMASDPSLNNLMPFFLRIALIQSMTSARLAAGESTLLLNGKILMEDNRSLEFTDYFSSQKLLGFFMPGAEASGAGDLIAGIAGVLMVNDFNPPGIKKIDLSTKILPGERVAKIHTVRQDKTEIKPGESLRLNLRLKTTKGKELDFPRTFTIPERIDTDRLTIVVSSARSLTQYELRSNPDKFRPVNFDNLLSILEKRRKNNNVYIQIIARDNGMMIEGEEFTDLPPSVLTVMDSQRGDGANRRLRDRVIFEDIIPTEYVIQGAKQLHVRVIHPQKAVLPDMEENNLRQPMQW